MAGKRVQESAVVVLITSIFLPPLGVFFIKGFGSEVVIAICLTILGWFPGVAYAMWLWLMAGGMSQETKSLKARRKAKKEQEESIYQDAEGSSQSASLPNCCGPPVIPAMAEMSSEPKGNSTYEPVDGSDLAATELTEAQKTVPTAIEAPILMVESTTTTEGVNAESAAKEIVDKEVVVAAAEVAPALAEESSVVEQVSADSSVAAEEPAQSIAPRKKASNSSYFGLFSSKKGKGKATVKVEEGPAKLPVQIPEDVSTTAAQQAEVPIAKEASAVVTEAVEETVIPSA